MLLYNWTVEQFGVAKAYFVYCTNTQPEPTLEGARKVLREWRISLRPDPLSFKFINVNVPTDIEWATTMFLNVAQSF